MEAKIEIEGEIGVETTLSSVKSQLDGYKEFDSVKVLINSPGGLVDEGFAIHDFLVSLNKPITSKVVGQCYSIATVIFLAGSERSLSENSRFMIHNPWGGVEGDAATMEQFAEHLRNEETRIVKFYSKKTGLGEEELRAMMDKETFMDKSEAVEKGFALSYQSKFQAVAKLSNQINKDKMTDKETPVVLDMLNSISEKLSSLVVKNEAQEEAPEVSALLLEGSEELGINIFIEAESEEGAVGAAAFVAAEDGSNSGEPAPDGTHLLADGRAVVVADGLVVEISGAEAKEDEEDEEMKALKEENESLKAKIEEMEGAKAELEESINAKESELSEVKASLESVKGEVEKVKAMTVGKPFAKAQTKEAKKEPKFKFPEIENPFK